ncbi:hypothetical protein [Flavobacterium sp.]|jgi:hypothetical protein|uniref:hypothetical protein n=1 Tax=Flavobacterium sp. TaxID=239 RepID=UPI0037BE3883
MTSKEAFDLQREIFNSLPHFHWRSKMAITSDDQTNNTTNAQAAAQPQSSDRRQYSSSATFGQPSFGLKSAFSAFGNGGDFYEKLYKKVGEIVKQISEAGQTEEKYSVTKVLKNVAGLNYSSIVVTGVLNGVASSHILMVERTGEYPEKAVQNINGVRYELIRTPSDALDEKYVAAVRQAVAASVKLSADDVIVTDGTLVPNEFDLESESLVAALMNNTINANLAELCTRVKDYRGHDIGEMARKWKNGRFTVSLFFNSSDAVQLNQVGMPVRQDVQVVLSFKPNNSKQMQSVNQGDDVITIVKTYGYIDFDYVGPQPGPNGLIGTQRFVPNFVITHIESELSPTPDIVMLAVASVLSLSDDSYWLQACRPTITRKGEFDFNDIGALNIEGNLENSPTGFGKRYDTKSKNATPMDLNRMVTMLSHTNMLVSIDVPKAGPETWYTAVFRYIKAGNEPRAYQRVVEFMQQATGGAFTGSNNQMFVPMSNKIHGGFYKANDGSFRDIRHLSNYLAVANYVTDTNQDPALLRQYTHTLYNASMPADLRAATRFTYLNDMSKQTLVVKELYERYTFSGGFLADWVRSLHSVGFMPVFSTNTGDGVADMFLKRSTMDFRSAAVDPSVRFMGSNDNGFGNFQGMSGYVRSF